MKVESKVHWETGKEKVAITRDFRPVIVETGKGDRIEYHEVPVPPPTATRRPANSPY